LAGVIAGALDGTAAVVFLGKMNAAAVFKFVASGVFGKAAFSGGTGIVVWGVVFHFFIALCWAAAYFCAYPRLPFLQKNKWVSGVLYGVFVWLFMNLLVVPLSQAPQGNFTLESVSKNMVILIFCIGLPIAWMAERKK